MYSKTSLTRNWKGQKVKHNSEGRAVSETAFIYESNKAPYLTISMKFYSCVL